MKILTGNSNKHLSGKISKYLKNKLVNSSIRKFSDSSIDMYIRCFTVTNEWSEWLKVKERLAVKIKEIVESNGASFAFPSTSVYVEKK